LKEIIQEIQDKGGGPVKRGKNKFSLKGTEGMATGLLVREVVDLRKGQLEQTMVPESLRKSTLRMHHEGYGHMGASRMLETIRLRYFWSNMDKDINDHTGKCLDCKLRKTYQRRPEVPLMKYDDTARPLDRVHIDLTGPLPTTKGLKHRYIMVIKDYLTKYVWFIPLKTKTAQEVAEAFVGEFVCQAGVPGRLVSDRGNEFVNQLLMNISRVMGINRVSTTPYNPRADGFVENHNKTLKDQLFHMVFNKEDLPEAVRDGVREQGEPLQRPMLDYLTRMDQYQHQEGEDLPERREDWLDQVLLDELNFENVEECEELADSVQFLNGRRLEDEGRMYEIMQVRYDHPTGRVIGFRRPLSGKTPHREDGSPFCVYGLEGRTVRALGEVSGTSSRRAE